MDQQQIDAVILGSAIRPFESFIGQLMSAANEQHSHTASLFNHFHEHHPDALVLKLNVVLHASTVIDLHVVSNLLKSHLISALRQEPDHSTAKKVADTISALAVSLLLPDSTWPDVLPFLFSTFVASYTDPRREPVNQPVLYRFYRFRLNRFRPVNQLQLRTSSNCYMQAKYYQMVLPALELVINDFQNPRVQGEEDYLSNLPDELLHHILSFLPTLDSIRISILARRWRHVWTSVPVIDFSYLPLKSSIIDRFFASRGGDSVSRLHVTGLRRVDRENVVYKLVEYAKSHDARHVTLLDFFFEQCRLSLFDLLFDWPSLVSLDLRVVGCKSRTLSKCIFRLSNLKTLSLALPENTIRNESLAKLLSGCPVLEELKLNADYLWDDELIQIEAPNLLRLTLIPTPTNLQINCQKLEYLRLNPDFSFMYLHVEAPSLTSVRLYNIWRFRTFAHSVCDVTAVAIILSDECLSSFTPKFLRKYKAVIQGFPIFHNLLELKIKIHVA
ncbi:putative F-box/LRR-repeat protein At3g28410 [Zingiber officinale]|uniref:putative F-box/LRR-repeat protein At3g28410 n=1 Tax=Zingiber officinale TaxID=94328 RepID=UPI001C4D8B92|nr:putative F-box/LRR-repeat protein At3g28410 [Zingiber officinale]